MNDLGVVLLTYGHSDEWRPLLEQITGDGLDPDQLVVVHNPDGSGSRPPSPEGTPILTMDRNLGYGAAMNAGLQHSLAQGRRWILLLTHDVRLRPGSLATLAQAAQSADRYGVLGPTLVDRRTAAPFSYGGIDMESNIVGHRLERPAVDEDGIGECQWVDGCALMLRAEAVRSAGALEARFFMYFEEPEFCLRAKQAGWKVGVVVDAEVETSPGHTRRPRAYGYLFCRNGLYYARRAGGRRRLARAARSQLQMVWYLAPRPYNRRFFDSDFRRSGYAMARGIFRGALGYARGEWGPPPAALRRTEDIRGT